MKRTLLFALFMVVLSTPVLAQEAWNSVTLAWTSTGDDSLTGTASQYDIRYSTSAITAVNFASATRVTVGVPIPAVSGTNQSAVIVGLTPLMTYWFAIKIADEVPNWSMLSNVVSKTLPATPDLSPPAAITNLRASP